MQTQETNVQGAKLRSVSLDNQITGWNGAELAVLSAINRAVSGKLRCQRSSGHGGANVIISSQLRMD